MFHYSYLTVLVLLSFGITWSHGTAAETPCDPSLSSSVSNPYGYRLRGDRCEGVYVQDVRSSSLRIVSFIRDSENHDVDGDGHLLLRWRGPKDGDIQVRAVGLKHRFYYRMDTIRPPGSTSYAWPTDLLSAVRLPIGDIGLLAWTTYPIRGEWQRVYVPLQIGDEQGSTRSSGYRLLLWPGRRLTEIFVTLARLDADGHLGPFLYEDEALQYGYYPAERGISILIPELTVDGLYKLEIGATLETGGSSTLELSFYHAAVP